MVNGVIERGALCRGRFRPPASSFVVPWASCPCFLRAGRPCHSAYPARKGPMGQTRRRGPLVEPSTLRHPPCVRHSDSARREKNLLFNPARLSALGIRSRRAVPPEGRRLPKSEDDSSLWHGHPGRVFAVASAPAGTGRFDRAQIWRKVASLGCIRTGGVCRGAEGNNSQHDLVATKTMMYYMLCYEIIGTVHFPTIFVALGYHQLVLSTCRLRHEIIRRTTFVRNTNRQPNLFEGRGNRHSPKPFLKWAGGKSDSSLFSGNVFSDLWPLF